MVETVYLANALLDKFWKLTAHAETVQIMSGQRMERRVDQTFAKRGKNSRLMADVLLVMSILDSNT